MVVFSFWDYVTSFIECLFFERHIFNHYKHIVGVVFETIATIVLVVDPIILNRHHNYKLLIDY